MAERGKVNGNAAAPKPPPLPPDALPAEALRARTAMFLLMTQGAGKQMQYPGPPKGKRGD